MASLKKNEWFVAVDKIGNLVKCVNSDLAVMAKRKSTVEKEVASMTLNQIKSTYIKKIIF